MGQLIWNLMVSISYYGCLTVSYAEAKMDVDTWLSWAELWPVQPLRTLLYFYLLLGYANGWAAWFIIWKITYCQIEDTFLGTANYRTKLLLWKEPPRSLMQMYTVRACSWWDWPESSCWFNLYSPSCHLCCLELLLYWIQQHIHLHSWEQSKEVNFGEVSNV